MSLKRLEALADSIASLNDYSNPESRSYELRNPGMLRAKTMAALGSATDDCIRIFSCHQAGDKALIDHLRRKCYWHPTFTLKETLARFRHGSEFEIRDAVSFICRTGEKVNEQTPLAFFLES